MILAGTGVRKGDGLSFIGYRRSLSCNSAEDEGREERKQTETRQTRAHVGTHEERARATALICLRESPCSLIRRRRRRFFC